MYSEWNSSQNICFRFLRFGKLTEWRGFVTYLSNDPCSISDQSLGATHSPVCRCPCWSLWGHYEWPVDVPCSQSSLIWVCPARTETFHIRDSQISTQSNHANQHHTSGLSTTNHTLFTIREIYNILNILYISSLACNKHFPCSLHPSFAFCSHIIMELLKTAAARFYRTCDLLLF